MAVDKKNEKLVEDRLSFMDDAVDGIEGLESIQEKTFKSLRLMLLKDLDLDADGNIKRNRKNQKLILNKSLKMLKC